MSAVLSNSANVRSGDSEGDAGSPWFAGTEQSSNADQTGAKAWGLPMTPARDNAVVMNDDSQERLVKSSERVRDLGEVFTPRKTVEEMLDMLPGEMWSPHPAKRFLEPGCGDGNFLVVVLERKLAAVADAWRADQLPAGSDRAALRFHALEALSSIYGVDISKENILGGVPEHPIGARDRMLIYFGDWYAKTSGSKAGSRDRLPRCAEWIVSQNVILGDLLVAHIEEMSVPLLSYDWNPEEATVSVAETTFARVIRRVGDETGLMPQLFGGEEPNQVWRGSFDRLDEIPMNEARD